MNGRILSCVSQERPISCLFLLASAAYNLLLELIPVNGILFGDL